jgi:hypothetical protein
MMCSYSYSLLACPRPHPKLPPRRSSLPAPAGRRRSVWPPAQRLAAGDELEQAAGFAGVEVEALRQLLDEDPGFARQCQAEGRVNALRSPGAWSGCS